ncbi:MAG: carbohydrate kinase family protein [Candidatus Zipacnadales bacterium]
MNTYSARPYTVMAFGDLNVDLILAGVRERPKFGGEVLAESIGMHAGGSTANVAACCAQLGLSTVLVTNVGNDSFGDFLIREMQEFGVATAHILRHNTLRTGITVSISIPDDRAFVTHLGTINSLTEADAAEELLAQARHLHVGSYYLQSKLQPDLPEVFRRAHEVGATTSLDPGFDPTEAWNGGLLECLREVDIFFPNETEAAGLTGCPHPPDALSFLAERCRIVALKLGPQGALGAAEGRTFKAPGFSVEVVDTTCCGDAFDAGFLYEWLSGKGIEECLRLGNACGALVATGPGNSAHLLSGGRPQALAQSQ